MWVTTRFPPAIVAELIANRPVRTGRTQLRDPTEQVGRATQRINHSHYSISGAHLRTLRRTNVTGPMEL